MRNRFESFAGDIIELNRCLQKIKEQEMKRFGLKAGHTMCLYYLGKHPEGLTASQLTELCKEDKAAISRCLGQLMERELISCRLPENKRSYRTLHFLTEQGQDIVRKMNDRIEYAVFHGGNGLSDGERENFYESLERILRNLTQYLEENEKAGGKSDGTQ